MRRKWIIVGLWLVGMLFPLAWLSNFSARYRSVFDMIFGPQWMHIVMHLVLFAVLVALVGLALRCRFGPRLAFGLLGLALGVGVLQEGLQLLSRGGWSRSALGFAGFDLWIDLLGAGIGLVVLYILENFTKIMEGNI